MSVIFLQIFLFILFLWVFYWHVLFLFKLLSYLSCTCLHYCLLISLSVIYSFTENSTCRRFLLNFLILFSFSSNFTDMYSFNLFQFWVFKNKVPLLNSFLNKYFEKCLKFYDSFYLSLTFNFEFLFYLYYVM